MLIKQPNSGFFRAIRFAGLLVGASALAACGGDGGGGDPSSSSGVSQSSPVSPVSSAPVSSAPVEPPFTFEPVRVQAQDYVNFNKLSPDGNGATTGPCAEGEMTLVETTDQGGICATGWKYAGEWLEYNISNIPAGEFDFIVRSSSDLNAARSIEIAVNGSNAGSVLSPGLGWEEYGDSVLEGVYLSGGSHTLRVTFPQGEANFNYLEVVWAGEGEPTPPVSSSPTSSAAPPVSSASSSSSAPDPVGDAVAGMAEFDSQCFGCHSNNGDSTFGSGGNLFDMNSLTSTTYEGLASYIDDRMPLQAPANCQGACADNVAAFLMTFVGAGSSSSASPDEGTYNDAVARGEQLFATECATCHDGALVQGLFEDENLRNHEIYNHNDLTAYIEEYMPLGQPGSCTGDCASDVTAFIATWHMVPMHPSVANDRRPGQTDKPVETFQCTQSTSMGNRTLRLLTSDQYQRTIEDLLGFTEDVRDRLPTDGTVGNFTNNTATRVRSQNYPQYVALAEDIAATVAGNNFNGSRIGNLCNRNYNQTCAERFVDDFGRSMFRRPLTSDERSQYLNIANGMETGGDVRDGIELALGIMLSSPQFLYRHEIGDPAGNGAYELSPYEMASFLSYSFAGTTPSQELLAAAGNNGLNSDEQIRNWASQLLDTDQARDLMQGAVHSWLRTHRVEQVSKDTDYYPSDRNLFAAMSQELSLLFGNVMLDPNGTYESLYAPGLTYTNRALSNHYGVAAPSNTDSNGFGAVYTNDRGGLLLSGAFLTLHGDSDEASPIRRAVNVRQDLLCQDVPPPPEGVDVGRANKAGELAAFLDHPDTSNRMASQRLTEDGMCKSCHAEVINPLGVGLEDYDTVGRFRTTDYNGNTIDPSGAVFSPYLQLQMYDDPERDTQRVEFRGGQELANLLATGELSDLAKSCLSTQMMSMFVGLDYLSITKSDRPNVTELVDGQHNSYNCDVQEMVETLSSDSPRAMLEQIGTLESIRYRRAW